MILEIKNLHAETDNKKILKGLNLTIQPNEIHAIMGPNGAGKSTLGNILAGKFNYEVTQGTITFNNKNLLNYNADERAAAGIFLSFQSPVEIPGVNNTQFLKTSINNIRKAQNKNILPINEFMTRLQKNMKMININKKYMQRGVNEGFSGGEKKRNEILQMLMLEPNICILDEIDSGLDIDGLKTVSNIINDMSKKNCAFIIITHYQRLLDYITPKFVHVLSDGMIIKSGDSKLAIELEKKGYSWINK